MPPAPTDPTHKGLLVAASVSALLALVVVISTGGTTPFGNLPLLNTAATCNAIINTGSGLRFVCGGTSVGNTSGVATTTTNGGKHTLLITRPVIKQPKSNKSFGTASNQGVLSGRYDIAVPKNASLATASSTVASLGGKVLFTLPYLHVVVAKLTASQEAVVAKNPSFSSVQQEQLVKPAQMPIVSSQGSAQSISPASSGAAFGALVGGDPGSKVAIVDDWNTAGTASDPDAGHGDLVLGSYQSACAADGCPDSDPALYSAFDPTGEMTDASVDNAILEAINNGATIINVSSNSGASLDSNGNPDSAGPITDNDLNLYEYAQNAGATIVYAAGNDPNYEQPSLFSDDPYSAATVAVGGLDSDGNLDPRTSAYAESFVNDVAPNGEWGTSFAAPKYAAQLDTQESNLDWQDTNQAIINTDNASDFLNASQVQITYNPDGSVASISAVGDETASQAASEADQQAIVDTGPDNAEQSASEVSQEAEESASDAEQAAQVAAQEEVAEGDTDAAQAASEAADTVDPYDASAIDSADSAIDDSDTGDDGTIDSSADESSGDLIDDGSSDATDIGSTVTDDGDLSDNADDAGIIDGGNEDYAGGSSDDGYYMEDY